MEKIEQAIKNEAPNVPEKNRDEWIRTCRSLAKLRLERGDNIEDVINFICS